MNIQIAQVQTSAPGQGVPAIFPERVSAHTGNTVIQFRPRIRADRLFDVLRSLGGLRPGDTVEGLGPRQAIVSIDVTGHHDKRLTARLKGGALEIAARSWGGETVLRRLDVADGARILRSWQSGSAFNVALTCEEDGPRAMPMRRPEAIAVA